MAFSLKVGDKLGPYEILALLAFGAMGEVYKARDTRLGRIVAIKKLTTKHSERFMQEARSIAALNHPNICQIHDIGADFLVLEYIEGKPLPTSLSEERVIRIAIQIATALDVAHRKGIIHRDLKPANIMLTEEGSVKVLDFGLSKFYFQDTSTSNLPTEDFPATQAGAILGTVAYMSPEQAQGQPADARSDIFSFGLVLYEMLSGRRAFSGSSSSETIAALLRDEPAPLKASPALEKIVKRCLEKNPADRYQTMDEVKAALAKAAKPKVTVSSEEPQPSIAVLPFVNMSGDKEQEYFSDGLAEEIINALTKIPGLKVIARTSAFAFKGRNEDIRKIAELLGVANILEGSVRKAGNRIRVTAQLITAADGSHLWSERFDRNLTDIFEVQDEIASAITNTLELKLSSTGFKKQYKPDLAAHEAYLKARYLWGKISPEHVAQAQTYLEEAVSLDPRYALAHCGLADHLLVQTVAEYISGRKAMPIVQEEARKALKIDPLLPEAHAMLGIVAGIYEYNWEEAARHFHMAMSQDPTPPRVRSWYGFFYLLPVGRLDESIEQQQTALKEDPLNLLTRLTVAISFVCSGRVSDAQLEAQKILEFEELQPWALWIIAFAYAHQMKWEQALSCIEKASPQIPLVMGTHAGVLKCMGKAKEAKEITQQLMPGSVYDSPLGLSFYYYLCGETEKAADCLEKLVDHRLPSVASVAMMIIKDSDRWPAIAKMMNLPEKAV